MRLIDADKLIRTMRADPLYFVVERYNIEGPIHAAPTIDAVPVVRCRDCKFAPKCYGDIARASKDGGVVYSPLGTNGYCSLAERKEE